MMQGSARRLGYQTDTNENVLSRSKVTGTDASVNQDLVQKTWGICEKLEIKYSPYRVKF